MKAGPYLVCQKLALSRQIADVVVVYVVPSVVPPTRSVVTAQQAVDLRIKEDVRWKVCHSALRHPGRLGAAGAGHRTISLKSFQAELAERMTTRNDLGFVVEPWDLADKTREELICDLLRVTIPRWVHFHGLRVQSQAAGCNPVVRCWFEEGYNSGVGGRRVVECCPGWVGDRKVECGCERPLCEVD